MLYLKLRGSALGWQMFLSNVAAMGGRTALCNWAKPPRQTQHSTFGTTQSKAQKGMQYRDRRGNNSQPNLLVAV